jgi:hypothetical protein
VISQRVFPLKYILKLGHGGGPYAGTDSKDSGVLFVFIPAEAHWSGCGGGGGPHANTVCKDLGVVFVFILAKAGWS